MFRQRGGGLDSFHECLAFFRKGAEVAFRLDTAPEVIGLSEKHSKADGHGGRDGSFPKDDLIDGAGRHADCACHGIL